MAKAQFQAPRGTRDLFPPDTDRQRALVAVFADLAGRAGYGQVASPIFEDLGVFQRIGESTDVVSKEMFDFFDKGDPPQHLALRPELTASICRAYAQHRPTPPWKVWYEGPQFRYEKPQAGRYRQFSQVGVEVLGADDPAVDVEVITLGWRFYEALGLRRIRLLINSLGDPTCRPQYLEALEHYFRDHAAELSEQSVATLEKNPLRVLDSKRHEDQSVIAEAPLMVDHLTPECADHFAGVTGGLDALGIAYELSPRLVRGLDYYTRTTFEYAADALDAAQNAVGGGGRYDSLVADLGGPPTDGMGFALGVDRILLACDAEGSFAAPPPAVQVFVVDMTDGTHATMLTDDLRRGGLGADRSFGGRSVKAQMKVADRSGARLAILVGEDEIAAGEVTVRDLRTGGDQLTLPRDGLALALENLLVNLPPNRYGDHPMTMRTDYCGTLRSSDIGRSVTVCGWVDTRRVHSEHLAFIDLRDHTGVVQCVVDEKLDLRSEYVVAISGVVRERFEGKSNENLATGEIEIGDAAVELLSRAEPPPFPMHERTDVDETIRLRHRYVDLRKPRMQRNLRTRAAVNSAIRGAMERQGFVEVETPMLIASTPEGARDFVVPSRLHPGSFYALPQSPQLFKQLCMVGGIDRYYQIARCLRDEDLRADRQFEFMQLDMEASFVTQDDVLEFVSEAVKDAAEAVTGARPPDIPRMTWHEAMERFGSDKPDVRFGMELTELSDIFEGTEANVFKVPCVKGIRLEGGAESLGRNAIDALTDQCKRWGAKGLAWFRVGEGAQLEGALTKFMSAAELAAVPERLEAEAGDMVFLIAAERRTVNHVLGLLRLELGRPPVNEGGFHFLWVTEFPLFEAVADNGRPIPAHHPFTMPHVDDIDRLDTAEGDGYLGIRSQAYDLVLNGWELGSGSVRIHRSDVQSRIFELLGIGAEEAQTKFGFLLEAFRYGAPPHAGFAFGIDRLAALLAGEENIREIIAFPKTQSGSDPLTNAPTPADPAHLEELGLRLLPPAAD